METRYCFAQIYLICIRSRAFQSMRMIEDVPKNAWTDFKSEHFTQKQIKKSILTYVCYWILFFKFNWKITFNSKYINYVIIYLQLTSYI